MNTLSVVIITFNEEHKTVMFRKGPSNSLWTPCLKTKKQNLGGIGQKASIPPRFHKRMGGIEENFIDSAQKWNIGL